MIVVQTIRYRDKFLIPTVIASLVATYQQNSCPARIEGVQRAKRTTADLGSQFTHVLVSGTHDRRAVRKRQLRTFLLQQANRRNQRLSFSRCQRIPPRAKFIRVFNIPVHALNDRPDKIFRQWNLKGGE